MKTRIFKAAVVLLIAMAMCPALTASAKDDIKQPDSYNYSRGREEYSRGNLNQAREYMAKELQDNPKNGYAYCWLAAIDMYGQDYWLALSELDQALKLLPKKDKVYVAYAHKQKAEVYVSIEEWDKAVEEYGEAIKATPGDENRWNDRGNLYYSLGRYEQSEQDYRQIISLSPSNPMGYTGVGLNLIAAEKYYEAISQLDYAIRLDATYSIAFSLRAQCYIQLEDWDKATDDLISALGIDVDEKAWSLMHSLEGEAVDIFFRKLKIQSSKNPNDEMWMYYAGAINEAQGKYSEAVECYKESMATSPYPATAHNIATCYGELGDYREGLAWVEKAIGLDPDDEDILMTKANLQYDSGDVEAAMETLGVFIQNKPDYYGGYYRRGFFEDNARMTDKAIEDYTYAITLKPDFAYAYLGRGDMYRDKGDTLRANADYRKVVELDTIPGDSPCAQYALLELGRRDEAIAFMDSVITSDKDNVGHYYDAACLYARMGETDKALDFLRTSLEKGYRRFAHMMIGDDLDALRETDGFRELMEEYQRKQEEENQAEDAGEEVEEVVTIPFIKDGGTYKVSCTINGLPLKLYFDTGAADVSLSTVEANFMMKNDYLKPTDVVGSQYFTDANGDINEGTVINLEHVSLAGLDLPNVRASVVRNQRAPLLLGQTVLSRLGRIEIDNENQQLRITHKVRK